MRKYASAEERAAKKQKTTIRHFGFTEKVYGLPCTVRTMLLWKRHHWNAIVHIYFVFFTGRHSSASASIYIYIYIYTNIAESRIERDYWPRYAHAARQTLNKVSVLTRMHNRETQYKIIQQYRRC